MKARGDYDKKDHFGCRCIYSANICAIKDLDPGEEAAYVSQLCSSAATHIPSAENIIASDANQISYSDCMADHGYLDRVSAD